MNTSKKIIVSALVALGLFGGHVSAYTQAEMAKAYTSSTSVISTTADGVEKMVFLASDKSYGVVTEKDGVYTLVKKLDEKTGNRYYIVPPVILHRKNIDNYNTYNTYTTTSATPETPVQAVSYSAGKHVVITDNNVIDVITGRVAQKNTGLVTGGDVYNVINPIQRNMNTIDEKISGQAEVINTVQTSVSNIGGKINSLIDSVNEYKTNFADTNLSNLSVSGKNVINQAVRNALAGMTGTPSFRSVSFMSVKTPAVVSAVPVNDDTATAQNTADIESLKKAEDIDTGAWTKALDAGKVEKDNTGLVSGGKVYDAISGKADKADVDALESRMEGRVSDMESRLSKNIAKAGAGAAALAALHPQEFDEDSKLTVAAGMGHYKNANAAAVGLFYRPNAVTLVSVSGTVGNGDNMMNAGVSFKVGKGSAEKKEQEDTEELKKELAEMKKEMQILRTMISLVE